MTLQLGREASSDGIFVDEDLFAIRLLELTRLREPEGNRVRFVHACETHGIRGFLQRFPDVWKKITDDPPREGVISDREFAIRCAGYALKVAAFQDQVLGALEQANIRALALKGLSLSLLLYGEVSGRQFGDADILVSQNDAALALQVCRDLGLRTRYPVGLSQGQQKAHLRYGKAQTFGGSDSAQQLDLHWKALSPWMGPGLLDFQDIWNSSQVLEYQGLSPWRTLGSAETVVFAALHGYQDGWNKMRALVDLCVALEKLDYDWDEVLRIADFRRPLLERAVELCVRLLGVPHPGRMTHHFLDYDHACRYWLKLATADKTPQRRLLRPELWSCHSSLALEKAVKTLFNPAVDDICSVSLPPSLVKLYPLVRAFRLVEKMIIRRG